ncbi:FixH family protein [Cystobacter fuscus]|uniref:FixH family protein n=1 Tax=Cystobacter fuscus TaxID=43 RepID=UPI0012FD76D3|nr:FixH family protein [Cystobacter fuscus]
MLSRVREPGTAPDAGGDTASGLVRLEAGFEGTLQPRGNRLRIHVTDTAGTPVEATRVSVSLWMPGHGHGAPAPAVTREARGDYLATVDFTMPGTWTVTIQVDTEGAGLAAASPASGPPGIAEWLGIAPPRELLGTVFAGEPRWSGGPFAKAQEYW